MTATIPASAAIPASHRDLLERPIVVTLVTVMPNGQPQASPVWFMYDGTHILINTARGRQKDRNMTADPRVTVLVIDPDNPYRYLEVRGIAVAVETGALDMINALAKRYRNVDQYYGGVAPLEQGARETRVTYKIRPTHVTTR
ncbi:MAG: PPOX class F420-dependent enzyme [Chloroflexota bacterium]|nr:MAG: PPOX class F420-dependent enzyme [Chloroflexota bacterium]